MPIISLFFLLTTGILSPTNFDNFFITNIKFEFGSIIKGFISTKQKNTGCKISHG